MIKQIALLNTKKRERDYILYQSSKEKNRITEALE